MSGLDPRLNAFRPDLADKRLEGKVDAARFIEAGTAQIAVPVADIRRSPSPEAGLDTQLLLGELVSVFDEREGWAWIQSRRDGYVGYAPAAALSKDILKPTNRIAVPRTFVYAAPDMKSPAIDVLSMGCEVAVVGHAETRGSIFAELPNGTFVYSPHLPAIDIPANGDHAGNARALLGTPYLWGGTSAFGIDCSGLVQLSMRMSGRTVLRDTAMQATSVGSMIDPGPDYANLMRGDLVFWKGHVGIMLDHALMIHASGNAMIVTEEPLRLAVERIAKLYGAPTVCRRP